jgi:hypothetical protein
MERSPAYWHTISHQRIAILGIVPPPLGGVSVHIARVIDCFAAQHNQVQLWNTEQRSRVLFPFYLLRLMWWLWRFFPHHQY